MCADMGPGIRADMRADMHADMCTGGREKLHDEAGEVGWRYDAGPI